MIQKRKSYLLVIQEMLFVLFSHMNCPFPLTYFLPFDNFTVFWHFHQEVWSDRQVTLFTSFLLFPSSLDKVFLGKKVEFNV